MNVLYYIKLASILTLSVFSFSINLSKDNSLKVKPRLQIPIISDTHIESALYTTNLIRALKDFKTTAPNYKVICIVGDLTNQGTTEQYDEFMKIFNRYSNSNAEKVITIGNHEFFEKKRTR